MDEKTIVLDNDISVKLIIYEIVGEKLNKESYEILKKSNTIYMVHYMSNDYSLMNIEKKYTPLLKNMGKMEVLNQYFQQNVIYALIQWIFLIKLIYSAMIMI